jgi:hypothetical protein
MAGAFNGPIVLGVHVEIDLVDRRGPRIPTSNGLIHDQSGTSWPRNSLLIGPFAKTGRSIDAPSERLTDWFGSAYDPKEGDVHFPPKDGWSEEGLVDAIWYHRTGGAPYGRQAFVHHIKKRQYPVFGKKIRVHLRSRGAWLRVDFPQGLVVSWKGIEEA